MYNFREGVYKKQCPYCATHISAMHFNEHHIGIGEAKNIDNYVVFHFFECPECGNMFMIKGTIMVDSMSTQIGETKYECLYPSPKHITVFDEVISNISNGFVKIYNESEIAESNNLNNISGPGYRKALEFLIKDYIIYLDMDKKEEVKAKRLGTCISEYIEDQRIKEVAKRTAWIGNDQTHYIQKWEEKDVDDMKEFISLIIYWIESEEKYKKIIEDMPRGK